jgi:hypothetical protein
MDSPTEADIPVWAHVEWVTVGNIGFTDTVLWTKSI